MNAIWAYLCMLFATSNDRGYVSATDLHRIMDRALADGWQPKNEAESPSNHRQQQLDRQIEPILKSLLD